MSENRPQAILQTLRKTFADPEWVTSTKNPFKTLIATIISQDTADRNTSKAFENLSNNFEITPETLAKAKADQIEQCIKVAGLQKNKAKTIKQVSTIILNTYHGDLRRVLSLPLKEARNTLMQMPGIGPKTADVVFLFSAAKPTIPVDTHVDRVAKRLKLAPSSGGYEAVRQSLQSLYDLKDFLTVHLTLISHGREYCTARNPLCQQCPVSTLCPSKLLRDT
jgi:endonuclease-3